MATFCLYDATRAADVLFSSRKKSEIPSLHKLKRGSKSAAVASIDNLQQLGETSIMVKVAL